MNKEYLGDSVYIEDGGYELILTTENGLPNDPSNKIVFDDSVLHNFLIYIERLKKEREKE